VPSSHPLDASADAVSSNENTNRDTH
jgi:hypothetical protein